MMTLLYQTLKLTLGYNAAIRRTWVMAAGSNIAFKIAAQLLQIETWLLSTALSNGTIADPYHVSFSQNTLCVTVSQTTYRTQGLT